MKALLALIKDEPVLFQAAIQAGLAMGMSFGLSLSVEQMGTVMAFTAAVLAFVTRTHVTPNHVADQRVAVALHTPVPKRRKQ